MDEKLKYEAVIVSSHRPQSYLAKTYNALVQEQLQPKVQYGSYNKQTLVNSGIALTENIAFGMVKCNYPEFDECPVFERHNLNVAHALERAVANKDILLLEDDVVPCVNLKHQIECIYNMLQNYNPDCKRYIIALYSTYHWGWGPQALLDYPPQKFYGLQACLISASIRHELSNAHAKNNTIPADMVTQQYVLNQLTSAPDKVTMFATRYSLFQHIGKQSSINNNAFHSTINFLDGEKNPYL